MFGSSDADVFSAAILPSYVIFFPSPSDAVLKPKSKVTFGRNDVLCKKRTRESHWFTPRQPVIFHSLPQRSLHWQDTSLMCSNEIKRFHRRLTIPPLSHSFHFIRLLDCLLNGLPHPPGKCAVCISFGQNETWLIYFPPRALCFWTFDQARLSSVKFTLSFLDIINPFQHILYIQVYIVAWSGFTVPGCERGKWEK